MQLNGKDVSIYETMSGSKENVMATLTLLFWVKHHEKVMVLELVTLI